MSARFFLDTNIFVYSYANDSPEKQRASKTLIARALRESAGVVSFQVIQEFFSVAFRRFSPRMASSEAEEYLTLTFAQFRTIHSSYVLYQRALELLRRYSLSWYDSLIVAAALEADCQILYTEDLQHGQKLGSLEVQNPFA